VVGSRYYVRLLGLPSLKGENNMNVKMPRGTMNGTNHVRESDTG
jgi:hypothetical protein